MEGYKTKIILGEQGRIVIPLKIRELMELRKGDVLVLDYSDGILQIIVLGEEK